MDTWYSRLGTDVSALPKAEPFFEKLEPLLRRCVEERSGARVTAASDAEFVVSFVLNRALAEEAYELRSTAQGVEISGADFNALVYGMGRFLHQSHYHTRGICPLTWRGVSVPKASLRAVYFAMHFFNWYQQCEPEEIERYIEDLMLWGVNAVFVIYPRISLSGWDDPNAEKAFAVLRKIFTAAKKMNMKTGYQSSNQDFNPPRADVAADKSLLLAKTGNLICTGSEEGYQHLKSMIFRILREAAKIGIDYMTFFSYDEGGCCCEKCWPWGPKGLYNYVKRMSADIRAELLPDIKIIMATWYFGRGEHNGQDWPGFYERIRQDEAAGDNWLDMILIETRDDPACRYILEHGKPSEKIPVVTFPDIYMMGVHPWGGYGAILAPKQLCDEQMRYAAVSNGCYMYSEGIADDMQKAICAQLVWDPSIPADSTIADYCGYEFPMVDQDKAVRMVNLIGDNQFLTHLFSKQPADLDKAEEAWQLAQELDQQISPQMKQNWRWRIVYIRTILDRIRYNNCAADGWPYENYNRGPHQHDFWPPYLQGNQEAEELMMELIHIYHALEVNDRSKFLLHHAVRPPLRNNGIN